METSKEELQSLNEELTTANTQLENKIGELEATNNDLDNLLTSTNIATLFLDTHLRIRRFTPAATRLFSLIASDIGRPIGDIAQKFADPDLLPDAAAVLQQPIAPKTEVQAHDGRWYVRQVLPYRTRDNRTEGVVITFSDVAAEALQEARLYAESIVDTVREPLLVLDGDMRVRSANQSFYATFHVSQEERSGGCCTSWATASGTFRRLRTLLDEDAAPKTRAERLRGGARFRVDRSRGSCCSMHGPSIAAAIVRISSSWPSKTSPSASGRRKRCGRARARKHVEDQVRQRQAELAHALRISTVGELASGLAHELNQPLSAIANGVEACARYVRSGKTTSKKLLALLDDASAEALRAGSIVEHLRHFIEKGKPQFERADLREIARNVPRLLGREIQQEHDHAAARLASAAASDLRGPHPDRADHREPDAERHRRDSGSAQRPPRDPVAGARGEGHGGSGRARHRRRRLCRSHGAHVRAVLHHQAERSGDGPGDQPLHHRGPCGPDLGGARP